VLTLVPTSVFAVASGLGPVVAPRIAVWSGLFGRDVAVRNTSLTAIGFRRELLSVVVRAGALILHEGVIHVNALVVLHIG